jgi:hypothetical protein
MRKNLLFFGITSILLFLIQSCSEKSVIEPKPQSFHQQDLVRKYTNKFIDNEHFAKKFGEIFKSQYNLGARYRNHIISREEQILDSTAYYADAAHMAMVQAQIMLIDSGYVQLSAPQVQEVMQNVIDSLSSESFRARYSDSPLVTAINQIIEEISTSGGLQAIDPNGRSGCDFTMNEIIGCVGGGLIAGIIDLAGPAKQIYNLVKGTGSWGFSEMFSFALSAVKAYVPWTKLFTIASAVAFCLVGAC